MWKNHSICNGSTNVYTILVMKFTNSSFTLFISICLCTNFVGKMQTVPSVNLNIFCMLSLFFVDYSQRICCDSMVNMYTCIYLPCNKSKLLKVCAKRMPNGCVWLTISIIETNNFQFVEWQLYEITMSTVFKWKYLYEIISSVWN